MSDLDRSTQRIICLLTLLGSVAIVTQAVFGAMFYTGVSPTNTFWTNGLIPYQFDTNYPTTAAQETVFLDFCREWELAANVHLIPRTNQTNYLRLRYDPGFGGGYFTIGDGTLANPSTLTVAGLGRSATHEMGHAIGFAHEHQRPDRDGYITINYSNIVTGGEPNYDLITNSLVLGVYDFESVMHYSRTALSLSPYDDVIVPKSAYSGKYYYRIGNLALSNGDRAAAAYLYGPPATPLTNLVTHTRDGGFGSLRAAIYYANDHPGTTIRFNIATNDPGYTNGVWKLQPTGDLPPIVADGTVIDGPTQPSYVDHPVLALDGSALIPEAGTMSGLHIYAANCTVKALAFDRFTQWGLVLETPSATNNVIQGCHIGIDAWGTNAAPNSLEGLGIFHGARYNIIGGTNAAARNVISGNANSGVLIADTNTFGNVILGNYIGLNAAGTGVVANLYYGVFIRSGASSNTVGGLATDAGNVISGNDYGITIADTNSDANRVLGNYIGTDAMGTLPLTNRSGGILVYAGARNTVIGGTNAAARNVLSGNSGSGIVIADSNTMNTVVLGNFIGTDPSGSLAVPNNTGILINNGAKNTIVGGTIIAMRNVISGNRFTGIDVEGTNTSGTTIQGNYIGVATNGTLAVGNGGTGVILGNGVRNLIIGGTAPGAGNLISGNGGAGISISGAGTISNSVLGNLVGTDKFGNNALSNLTGVSLVDGAQFNRIGDASPAGRNVISGNRFTGIDVEGTNTIGTSIQGNYIGVATNGMLALGNGGTGIILGNGVRNLIVGGAAPGAGNLISGNGGDGISVSGAGTISNSVLGNLVGTDKFGTNALPNATGVSLSGGAQFNRIGDASPGGRNVISGNRYNGLLFFDVGTSSNSVLGNYIGTTADGTGPLTNYSDNVAFVNGPAGNVVGGTSAAARNLISAGLYSGVYFYGAGTDGNIVQGNFIGTDVTGNIALGNSSEGVALFGGARGNLIGGAAPGAGNVIAASRYRGVILAGSGTCENLVQGNNIGVGADGATPLGNGDQGILFYGGASNNVVGLKTDNSGAGNRIANSFYDGVHVDDTNSVGNTIRGNAIYSNGGLGIDLAAPSFWGVTPNDGGDGDAGPNNLQNYPILTNGSAYPTTTIVLGTLNGTANRTFLIDVYRNLVADVSGYGEGQNYLGSSSVTTDAGGNASFSFTTTGNFAGQYFTTTATDTSTGDSSEFSAALLATNAPPPPQFIPPLGYTGTGFVVTVSLSLGQNYRIQATTNLSINPIPWVDLTNFLAVTTNFIFLDRGATNRPIRFYRAVSP